MQRGVSIGKLTLCTKWPIYMYINNQQKTENDEIHVIRTITVAQ